MSAQDAIAEREARMRERHRPAPTVHELVPMKKDEIIKIAEARGLPTTGTKVELIERLTDGR